MIGSCKQVRAQRVIIKKCVAEALYHNKGESMATTGGIGSTLRRWKTGGFFALF